MNENEQEEIAEILKRSVPPVNAELSRDLWPKMLRRLEDRAGIPWCVAVFSTSRLSLVPWFDWALLAVLIGVVCAFPKSIPIWLYHF